MRGVTNSAICILLPTATPKARSIYIFELWVIISRIGHKLIHTLFLKAQVTAVRCSAALPTTGIRIRPTNVSLMCHILVTSSIAETKNSAQTPTITVTTTNLFIVISVKITLRGSRNLQCDRHPCW
jgi:hypothetical protein